MATMARPLVSDELWGDRAVDLEGAEAASVSGSQAARRSQGADGILFVLQTGIPWEYLPQEMGCGSGMTCCRRLREWQEAGVWQRLHELLLARLSEADRIDWSRAVIDSSHVRAFGGAPRPARARVHRSAAAPSTT
jgi:transposase